jgi:hypothetical protein
MICDKGTTMNYIRKLTIAAGLGACLLTAGTAHAGWYLLSPPWASDNTHVASFLPLPMWQNIGAFDTAKECEQDLRVLRQVAKEEHNVAQPRAKESACFETTDPRLGQK